MRARVLAQHIKGLNVTSRPSKRTMHTDVSPPKSWLRRALPSVVPGAVLLGLTYVILQREEKPTHDRAASKVLALLALKVQREMQLEQEMQERQKEKETKEEKEEKGENRTCKDDPWSSEL